MGPRRVIIGMTSGFHAAHQHIFISRLFCDTSISIQNISFIIHDIVTLRFCTRVPRVRGPMGRSCVFAVMLLSHFHPAIVPPSLSLSVRPDITSSTQLYFKSSSSPRLLFRRHRILTKKTLSPHFCCARMTTTHPHFISSCRHCRGAPPSYTETGAVCLLH